MIFFSEYKEIFNSLLELYQKNGVGANDKEGINLATQTTLTLLKAKEEIQRARLENERLKVEIQNLIAMQKSEVLRSQALTAQALIQSDAIARSVKDNANINKANGIIQLASILGNVIANNTTQVDSFMTKVGTEALALIRDIDTSKLGGESAQNYEIMLKDLGINAILLGELGNGGKSVAIFAPRLLINVNESLEIMGFSTFGDNESYFLIQDFKEFAESRGECLLGSPRRVEGKFFVFSSKKDGKFRISFCVKDNKGEIRSDFVDILVREESKKFNPKRF